MARLYIRIDSKKLTALVPEGLTLDEFAQGLFSSIGSILSVVLTREAGIINFDIRAEYVGRFDRNALPLDIDIMDYTDSVRYSKAKQEMIVELVEGTIQELLRTQYSIDWKIKVSLFLLEGAVFPTPVLPKT